MSDVGVNLGHARPMRETEKALLVNLDDGFDDLWVPKSVIHDDSECYSVQSGDGDLIVSRWWAENAGLA